MDFRCGPPPLLSSDDRILISCVQNSHEMNESPGFLMEGDFLGGAEV